MLIIKAIFSIIPLLGISFYLSKKGIQKFYIPVITISILIFSLYFFAIFDCLKLGWYLISIVGSFLFFVRLKDVWVESINCFSTSNLSFLLYLIPFAVVLNAVPANFQLSYWDEFADWGLSIKYMFSEDRLYSLWREGYFNYGHYPPAQQLFQYYFLKFFGWSEKFLIWIELFLLLLIQLSCFGTQKNKFILGGLLFIASFAVPNYFHFFYNNIYVDTFLALYFASAFLYLLTSKNTILENLIACLMLFVLVQIKQIGLIFALILLACYLCKVLVSNCSYSQRSFIFQPIFLPSKRVDVETERLPLVYFASAAASIFLSHYSWALFKKINSVVSNKPEVIPSLIKFFENPLADRLRDTTHLFIIRFSESSFTLGVKFYYLIIALLILGATFSLFANKSKRASDFLMLSIFGIGSIFYFLFVLVAYVLFFSYEEGIVLSGFERYTAIYFIAWCIVLLGYLTQRTLNNFFGKVLLISIASIILFIAPPKDFYRIVLRININEGVVQDRRKVDLLISQLESIPKDSKIYFVAQGYGGFIHRVFQYSASPMNVSIGCHSFGKKYHSEDADTCDSRLEDGIKGYDYLVLYYGDGQFWGQNRSLFEPNIVPVESGVFKIAKDAQGRIRLLNL